MTTSLQSSLTPALNTDRLSADFPFENKSVKTVTAESMVNLTREQCWELLSDISLPHNYVPGILKTELVTEQTQGVGASRLVYQKPDKSMGETVTEWREGKGFTLRIHHPGGGPQSPFKEASFTYAIAERDGTTLLQNSMSYELAGGLFGKLLDVLLVHRLSEKTIQKVTSRQAAFYEEQFS